MEAIRKKLTTLRIEVEEANTREQKAREDLARANEEAEQVRLLPSACSGDCRYMRRAQSCASAAKPFSDFQVL